MTNEDILTAENAVLGACLCDAPLWGTVLNTLHETDLAGDASRAILHAARMLDAEGKTPDAPAVADLVQQDGVERGYLMQLMDVACAPAALDQNIAAIKRSTRLRALAQLGESMVERAHSGDEPNSIAGDAAKVLDELDSSGGGELIDGTAAALDFYNAYDQRTSGRSVYVPVGISGLDTLFGGGMLNNGLYIMAARPGCCKTTLALQIADTVAQNMGGVLFVTLEMDATQLTARRVARATGIPSNRLLMGTLTDREMERVTQEFKRLNRSPFYLNKAVRCSVSDVRALARQVKELRLVVIDYLGLLNPEGKHASRYEEITAISGDLKALARSLGVPVLCLAQLNRASEQRQDKRPSLADLRDSGAIEQDADGVLLLHREDMYWAERPDEGQPVTVECILAKHRHGAVGTVTLALDLKTGFLAEIQR